MSTVGPWQTWLTPIVELGIGATYGPPGPSFWGVGKWGSARWGSGFEASWSDVSEMLVAVHLDSGSGELYGAGAANAATATIYDPTGELGPASTDPGWWIGRRLRWSVIVWPSGELVPIFHGVISTVSSAGGPTEPTVIVTAYDTPLLLAGDTGSAVAPDPEPVTVRLARLAEASQIPAQVLDLEADTVPLAADAATDYATAWINAVEGSGGKSFTTGAGVLTYRSRNFYSANPPSSTVQQSFTVAREVVGAVAQPADLVMLGERDQIRNDVMLTGGDDVTPLTSRATDPESVQRYGRMTDTATLLTADQGILDTLASLRLFLWSDMRRGIPDLSVTVYDEASASTVRRRFGDRIELVWDDAPARWVASAIVVGVAHDVTAAQWATTLTLAEARGLEDLTARWGSARWGVSQWTP